MLLASLCLLAANAYELNEVGFGWQSNALDHPFVLSTSSFPASVGTASDIEAAFIDGMETWEGAGAPVDLSYGGRLAGASVGGDGQLSARWAAGPANDFTLATAVSWGTVEGQATDCDIEFYGANVGGGTIQWVLAPNGGADLVDAAAHEVGHCLGLAHSALSTAQMAADLRGLRGLTADDEAGLQALFGGGCGDGDGDGFDACAGDCDDDNVLVHPGVAEACDGVDNDCDGVVDAIDTVSPRFGTASNTIGRGGWGNVYRVDDDAVLHTVSQYLALSGDTRLTWSVYDDVGGTWTRRATVTEEASAATGWFSSPALDVPLVAGQRVLVLAGVEATGTFFYGLGPGTAKDGMSPQGVVSSFWVPADDFVGATDATFLSRQELVLSAADADGDGLTSLCGDCDDSTASGAEVCDGIDNDCDGQIDEGYADADGDGAKDCVDVCVSVFDPAQLDSDGDGVGDACETATGGATPPGTGGGGCSCAGPTLSGPLFGAVGGMALLGLTAGWRRRS